MLVGSGLRAGGRVARRQPERFRPKAGFPNAAANELDHPAMEEWAVVQDE
jgi:hypothetical protein